MAGNNVFVGGKGLFTAWDPWSALRAKPPPTWVAVMPDKMTPELAGALKQAGIALVIWEPMASQAGVDAVNKYGAAGYIAQAEGPDQLQAALQYGSQVTVPKALVTNNFMPAYPPGWIAMPEAYQNNDPNQTPERVTADAQNLGATTVIPVIGVGFADQGGAVGKSSDYTKGLAVPGVAGSAAYIAEQMTDEDLNTYTSGQTPTSTPSAPKAPAPVAPQQPEPQPVTPTPAQQPAPPPPQGTPPQGQVPPAPHPLGGGIRPGHQAPDVEDVPDPAYATAGWGVVPESNPFRPEGGPGGYGPPRPNQRGLIPYKPPMPQTGFIGRPPPQMVNSLQPFAPYPDVIPDWLRNLLRPQ